MQRNVNTFCIITRREAHFKSQLRPGRRAAGYRFDEYSTLDALRYNRVPVLFVHGKEDKFVPTWMSQKNYEACPGKKRILLVENAGHGSSVFENQPLYEKTEKEFLADALGE